MQVIGYKYKIYIAAPLETLNANGALLQSDA